MTAHKKDVTLQHETQTNTNRFKHLIIIIHYQNSNIMKTKYIDKDLLNCHLFIVNGIICDFIDFYGKQPTILDIKNNWQYQYNKIEISDNKIWQIINAVISYI